LFILFNLKQRQTRIGNELIEAFLRIERHSWT
jgi:hypothetical protein